MAGESEMKKTKGKVSKENTAKPMVKKEEQGYSPLLERFLQKNMTDRMQAVDDEVLAKAIKTLLFEENKKNKRLN